MNRLFEESLSRPEGLDARGLGAAWTRRPTLYETAEAFVVADGAARRRRGRRRGPGRGRPPGRRGERRPRPARRGPSASTAWSAATAPSRARFRSAERVDPERVTAHVPRRPAAPRAAQGPAAAPAATGRRVSDGPAGRLRGARRWRCLGRSSARSCWRRTSSTSTSSRRRWRLQRTFGERLASVLVRQNILTEKFAVTYLGRQLGVPARRPLEDRDRPRAARRGAPGAVRAAPRLPRARWRARACSSPCPTPWTTRSSPRSSSRPACAWRP